MRSIYAMPPAHTLDLQSMPAAPAPGALTRLDHARRTGAWPCAPRACRSLFSCADRELSRARVRVLALAGHGRRDASVVRPAAAAAPAPSAPKAEPAARQEAGQVVDEELMDAILLEAA